MSKLDIKFKRLTPFKRCVLQNFPFIEEDFDALTNYSLLCKIVEYLNKVIASQNEVEGVTEEIVAAFNNLYDYVKNYFNNLDVQDEINNKLDQMAEDGTLDAIINNYDKVLFVAPKRIAAQVSSFDANLIIYRDKSIAIDVGYVDVYQSIIDMYNNYDVSTLDYVVITHWDADHIGNLKTMITNGVITPSTVVYMPAEPSYVNQTTVQDYKDFFTEHNITWNTPTTGDVLEIGLLKMTFLNCDLETLEQYAGNSDARNLMSTILLIEHKDVKALYTGDADNLAYKNLYEKKQVNCQIDLYKIGHHGFNVGTYQPFIKSISPKYALQTASLSRMTDSTTSFSEQIALLNKLGTVIYPCGIQEDYIEFLSDGYEMHVQQGEPITSSIYANYKDVYVDVSVNTYDIQDGTEEHPFKELEYAIACMSNYNYTYVNFHLADGIYGVTTANPGSRLGSAWLTNLPYSVKLIGNSEDNTAVKIYGFLLVNSKLSAKDLTILCDYRQGLYVEDGNVHLENVKFTTVSGSASTYSAIASYRSNIALNECDIEYVSRLFTGSGSLVSMRSCNATNITNADLIPNTGDNTFNIRDLNSNVIDYAPSYYNPPVLLFDGTAGSATLTGTINGTFSDYQALDITINGAGSRTIPIGRIYYPRNGLRIPFMYASKSSTYTYQFTGDVVLSSDNTVSLENLIRIQTNRSTGEVNYSDETGTTNFSIHDVRGIKTKMLTAPSE